MEKTFSISIISDPHVLAKNLMVDSKDFYTFTKFDRKLLIESEDLLTEALNLSEDSKYVILPGDLTKDGEELSHMRVSSILEKWLDENPGKQMFVLPGNHDINNTKSFDYRENKKTANISPNDFLKIYDFTFKNKNILEFYKDTNIFSSYLATINAKYDREDSCKYYAQGYLSYVARLEKEKNEDYGLTIICLDTAIYSCDNETVHKDKRGNVPGYISENLMIWTANKIDEAKKRKDMILIFGHHAIIPNFRNSKLVFSPFIIKNWHTKYKSEDTRLNGKTPVEVLADQKVKFVFTGHLHENGTSKFTSSNKNEIFDIQTGSPVTYPLPIRKIKITDDLNDYSGFSLDVKTQLIKSFRYMNLKGEEVDVDNATLYTLRSQLTLNDVIFNYAKTEFSKPEFYNMDMKREILDFLSSKLSIKLEDTGYVNELFLQILKYFPIKIKKFGTLYVSLVDEEFALVLKSYNSTVTMKASDIEAAFENILNQVEEKIFTQENLLRYYDLLVKKILSMPLSEDGTKTVYDFANYIYQYKALDEEERPKFVDDFINKLNDPNFNLIDTGLDYAKDEINEVYNDIGTQIVFEIDGSKKVFFRQLIKQKGFVSNIALLFLIYKLNNLKDFIDLIAKPALKIKHADGIHLAKYIAHSKKVTTLKQDYSKKMFGTRSLRQYAIKLVESMSNELVDQYENEDFNELDHYFNYIEYKSNKK